MRLEWSFNCAFPMRVLRRDKSHRSSLRFDVTIEQVSAETSTNFRYIELIFVITIKTNRISSVIIDYWAYDIDIRCPPILCTLHPPIKTERCCWQTSRINGFLINFPIIAPLFLSLINVSLLFPYSAPLIKGPRGLICFRAKCNHNFFSHRLEACTKVIT